MRRTDREIMDEDELVEVLRRCDVLRVAMNTDTYPYMVPLSFGCEMAGGRLYIYVHGAREGMRHELLARDWRVCFEADHFDGYVQTEHGISSKYESIVGFGRTEVMNGEAAEHGMECILAHCGFAGFKCPEGVAARTSIWRITVSQMTGKRHE